jgi:hypothetical protein
MLALSLGARERDATDPPFGELLIESGASNSR